MEPGPNPPESTAEQSKMPIGIDCSEANVLRDKIQGPALHPVAANFSDSMERVSFLLITPNILVTHGYAEVAAFHFFESLAFESPADMANIPGRTFDEWRNQVEARVREVRQTDQARKAWVRHLGEVSIAHVSELETDVHTGQALRAIAMAALVFGWTALEVMFSDAWEALLNAYPVRFGHPAFRGIADETRGEPDISSKQVAVGLLARHGFDLRNTLGTALRPKFDFTNIANIRKAYRAAFGSNSSLDHIFESANLGILEAHRHLIVHRAGIVDDEFRLRTKCATAVGLPVPLEPNTVRALLQSAVADGSTLLLSLNSIVMAENGK